MARFRKAIRIAAYTGLALPLMSILAVPLYARALPRLAGLPFFYWFQFAWIFLSVVLMTISYRLLQRADRGVRAPEDPSGPTPPPWSA